MSPSWGLEPGSFGAGGVCWKEPPFLADLALGTGQEHALLNRASKSSQNHRITEWWGLEGTSVDHPTQPPCRSRVTQSRLHSTVSRRGLSISREEDATTMFSKTLHRAAAIADRTAQPRARWWGRP